MPHSGIPGADFDSGITFRTGTTTNASEDSTAPGTNPVTSLVSGDFTDEANDDYSIPDTDSALFNTGFDLETIFSALDRTAYTIPRADIISTTRPQDTEWDIGCFELVVAAASLLLMQRSFRQ